MRITQQNKLIRLVKAHATKANVNQYKLESAVKKVLEAKTVDEKIYAIDFLLNTFSETPATKTTYLFNAGDQMTFHDNIYKDGEHCAICGRTVEAETATWVEVHNGGDLVEFGKGIHDAGYMGCWAIGSDCANKFAPELRGNIHKVQSL